jgi:hypothetical protein
MLSDPTLSLAVVSSLNVALVTVGVAALGRVPAEPCEPRFVACHCARPGCSGLRRVTVVRV